MAAFAEPEADAKCGICLEDIIDAYQLDCAHKFCRGCINVYKKHGVNDVCPYCRAPLPSGFEYSIDQCHQMGARIDRYEADDDTKRLVIARRLHLYHAQKAVNANPKDATARSYLAIGLETVNGDHDGAEREFRESIRLDPGRVESHYHLGLVLIQRKDFDGAEHEFCEVVRCDPNFADAHVNLGTILCFERKDIDGAILEYRKAIRSRRPERELEAGDDGPVVRVPRALNGVRWHV
jgi:tetratricopeptide (TPR) repeat protein